MRKCGILFAAALLFAASWGWAQERTGNIYGTVVDDQGQPLPGVKVILTGSRTARLETIASAAGAFRFLSLAPAEDYKVAAELDNFKTAVQENIAVRVGTNVDLKLTLVQGAINEQVVVTAATPIVDTKKTTLQNNLDRNALQSLPSARDPWVVLQLASGVLVDRENIGGSESGQQSNFSGRGDSGNNAQWNLDGVNISDPSAVGASPMYWDFDMIEEMNIQTAANDVTAVTGGININFVTPRGGNKLRGGARFYLTDKSFQSDNLTSELRTLELAGNKVRSVYDYGFNVGGPIVRDKLWFWGSYGVQDINQLNITGQADDTDLTNYNLKLNAQLGNHRFEFYGNINEKRKDGRRRSGGYLDEASATWLQESPGWLVKAQDEVTIGPNFYFSAKASFSPSSFKLTPKGGLDAVMYWDRALDIQWGSGSWLDTSRPQWYGDLQGNLFIEKFLGANHELKFGVEYKTSTIDSASGNGNGLQARLRNGVPYEVRMYNSFGQKFAADRVSGYVQDTIGFGRLTLNLGLRYDRQTGGILDYTNTPTNVDAVRNVGGVNYNWGTVTQTAADFPFTWNMLSPRVGFTYDLFGNGKTILKGGFSVYGSQFDATAAWTMWFVYDYHRFRWTDANGDKTPQGGELTYLSTLGLSDLASSTAEQIGDYFSSSLTPEKTAEFVLSLEHELKADFAVGLNFQYRKMYDFNWQHLLVLDYATDETRPVQHKDWVESGTIEGTPYWDIDWDHVESTYTDIYTKRPDYYERYWGLEFNFKKRLSHRWMLDGSFTYQDHRVFYPTTASYQDPTSHLPVDRLDGQPMAYQAAGSGSSDVFLNSRWMFKLAGIYELPYGINLSGTLTGREGYIAPLYAVDYDWYNWDDEYPAVWLEDFGKTRDPNVYLLNLRLEKKFRFADRVNLYLTADGFNIFNSNVQLARNRNKSADNYGQTLCIMNPRIFRLGARVEF